MQAMQGFLGIGIGKDDLEILAKSDFAGFTSVMDASPQLARQIVRTFPQAAVLASLDILVEVGVDGIVIATPSAWDAEQAVDALERGMAIFCRKPSRRISDASRWITETANTMSRLLDTDFSYRFISLEELEESTVTA